MLLPQPQMLSLPLFSLRVIADVCLVLRFVRSYMEHFIWVALLSLKRCTTTMYILQMKKLSYTANFCLLIQPSEIFLLVIYFGLNVTTQVKFYSLVSFLGHCQSGELKQVTMLVHKKYFFICLFSKCQE
jgi:hypothetical protein